MDTFAADKISVTRENENEIFRRCPVCGTCWNNRDQFAADAKITLIGYQADIVVPREGLFMFNHTCGATISLAAHQFADLYHGPVFEKNKAKSQECPGYCLHRNEFRSCPVQCECAFVREILDLFL